MSEREQVAIFCPVGCAGGAMQRILIDPADSWAICPTCKRSYRVSTRQIEKVSSMRLNSGRHRYVLEIADDRGGRRLLRIETNQGLSLKADTLVTFVKRGAVLIGVSDHSRELWFTVEPAPSRLGALRGVQRFLDYMSAIVLFCVLLVFAGYVPQLQQYVGAHGSASLLLVLLAAVLAFVPVVFSRLNLHVSAKTEAEEEAQPQTTLPPLKLPDID